MARGGYPRRVWEKQSSCAGAAKDSDLPLFPPVYIKIDSVVLSDTPANMTETQHFEPATYQGKTASELFPEEKPGWRGYAGKHRACGSYLTSDVMGTGTSSGRNIRSANSLRARY